MVRPVLVRAAACAAALLLLVCADLAWRGRSAYLEGEKYMRWHAEPALKRAALESILKAELAALDAALAAGRLDQAEHAARTGLARAEFDESLSESSLKYAAHWFRTATDLFTPPETPWTRASRRRLAEALDLWKAELRAADLPVDERLLP